MIDVRVILVASHKAVPVSHLIAASASGPPWLVLCGAQVTTGVLRTLAEVEHMRQTPCPRCSYARWGRGRVRQAFARPDEGVTR